MRSVTSTGGVPNLVVWFVSFFALGNHLLNTMNEEKMF